MLQALVVVELSPGDELRTAHRASELSTRRNGARQRLLGPGPRHRLPHAPAPWRRGLGAASEARSPSERARLVSIQDASRSEVSRRPGFYRATAVPDARSRLLDRGRRV